MCHATHERMLLSLKAMQSLSLVFLFFSFFPSAICLFSKILKLCCAKVKQKLKETGNRITPAYSERIISGDCWIMTFPQHVCFLHHCALYRFAAGWKIPRHKTKSHLMELLLLITRKLCQIVLCTVSSQDNGSVFLNRVILFESWIPLPILVSVLSAFKLLLVIIYL